jgi:Uma2 family endonuclease
MAYEPHTAPQTASLDRSGETMTYEEFLEWPGDNHHVEWVNGKIVSMIPVTEPHESIRGFLFTLFRLFSESHQLGKVYSEPFQMKTAPNLPSRAPDIFFVANANAGEIHRLHLKGPADLVVEIISPGSRATDRGDKFYEYEQGGVPGYWLIDPECRQAEFYLRGEDGIYRLDSIGQDGVFRSKLLPGLWIKVDWLWQTLPPPVLDVLREWRLI